MNRERRIGMVVALGTTLLLGTGLAAAGEVYMRHRERTRNTTPSVMPLLYYQHRRLRHALVRDFDYFGWVRINRDGFRGAELQHPKPPMRIIAVGSSTTFDVQTSHDSMTWAAQLGRRLGVEVINAGVPGYTVLDNLIRLQTQLHRYSPDIIILYEGHNDLFNALSYQGETFEQRPGQILAIAGWKRWLNTNSMLYTKLAAKLQAIRLRRRTEVQRDTTGAWEAASKAFERDLTSFVAIAHSMGIRVVMPALTNIGSAEAHWRNAVPWQSQETVLAGYQTWNSIIRRVAERFGAKYLQLEVRGAEHYAEGDPIHFNDAGATLWASQLAGVWSETVKAPSPRNAGLGFIAHELRQPVDSKYYNADELRTRRQR